MIKRHEIQVLRRAGHTLAETARLTGVAQRTVQRVEAEPLVTSFETDDGRGRRQIGRPSKAEPYRAVRVAELTKQPDALAVELLRRAQQVGYAGGKSALYALVKVLRLSGRGRSSASRGCRASFRSMTSARWTCASSMGPRGGCNSLPRA